MLDVYSKRFPNHKILRQIKLSRSRERERFSEFLITPQELPYCYDIGEMYKISKKETSKILPITQFNSDTARRISITKLHEIINELLNEYVSS